jgi:hypothetical protein
LVGNVVESGLILKGRADSLEVVGMFGRGRDSHSAQWYVEIWKEVLI